MKIVNKLIPVLICLFVNLTFGQNFSPIFKNISDELPSSEVHDTYQDSIGYIWFATDKGIVRFDGEDYLKLNTEDHFTASTFQFFQETREKVWFNTGENELYWFNPFDDTYQLHPYIFNDTLTKTINKSYKANFIRMLYMEGNSCRITFLKGTGYLEIDKQGNGTLKNKISKNFQSHQQSNLYLNQTNKFSYTEFAHNELNNGSFFFVNNDYKDTILITNNYSYVNFWLYGISDICYKNQDTYFLVGRYLIKQNKQAVSFIELPSDGIKLFTDDDYIFACTFDGTFEIDTNLNITNTLLSGYSVSSILKDHENGFWFSTLNNGVFHTKNIQLKFLKNTQKLNPNLLMFKNDKLCVMDNNKRLIMYSKDGKLIDSYNSVYYLNHKFSSPNSNLQKHLGPYTYFDPNNKIYFYTPSNNPKTQYQARNKVVSKFEKGRVILIKVLTDFPFINDCFKMNDSTLLLATKEGVYNFNLNNHYYTLISETNDFKKIAQFNSTILLSSNKGLFIYYKARFFNINTSHNILHNQLEGFHIQNDSIVWLYSHKGINKLTFEKNALKRVEPFSVISGLASNEVTSFTSDSTCLWIGTKKGICKINIDYQLSNEQINSKYFIIDSALIDQTKTFSIDTINLAHDSKLILFFKYITYSQDKAIQFEYQIGNSEWIRTNPNNLIIQNENPGIHSLKIRPLGKTDQIVFQNTIIISPPISEQLWFRIVSVFALLLTIFIGFKFFIRFENKKREALFEKLNLELKLLTSQMNPHFTFNTINSIQHYILKNDKKEAMKYLSDFALLIRQTLDFSFNNSITLEQEIIFLNLYLKLENKRFENNFIIQVNLADSINPKTTRIPSLLLQPLIENVIIHANYEGLQDKIITLKITDHTNYLNIKIIDNGIGKKKNSTLTKHKSYGLEIIQSRLKIYNGSQYKSTDLSFEHTNKEKQTGNTTTIKLHKNEYNYS